VTTIVIWSTVHQLVHQPGRSVARYPRDCIRGTTSPSNRLRLHQPIAPEAVHRKLLRVGVVGHLYIGSSTFPASQIVEGQWVARERNLNRFVSEQPPYSLLVRGVEADVLPTCQRYGMGVIPWSPSQAVGCRAGGVKARIHRLRHVPECCQIAMISHCQATNAS
jgi:aryl-alcohol dehydrogenase-like predicted oxidoreductase